MSTDSSSRQVWSYYLGRGWRQVPNPLPEPCNLGTDLPRLGYHQNGTFGLEDSTLQIEWFTRDDGSGLLWLGTFGRCFSVLTEDLPSTLELLRQLLPLVEAAQRSEAAADAQEAWD